MTIYKISLERIQANPWQTRSKAPAAEYIKELALDIAANGMLQTPMGRILTYTRQVVDHLQLEGPGGAGGYLGENKGAALQLAFGHNRLAAYRWLYDLRDNSDIEGDWSKMPVDVRSLTDEQMATLAWSENEKRRDLTAIERARAIQQRLESFKWSNRECAEALGVDHSTVSNLLRLLKLPDEVQEAIEAGELSERQALAILPLYELPEGHTERHWGDYYYYGSPANIEKAALEGESSDALRKRVERFFGDASQDLAKAEFKLDQLFPEGEAIYCGLCKTCDRRLASRNRCFDKECYAAKTAHVRRAYLDRASQASGYPAIDDTKGGYTSRLPYNAEDRARIIATGCQNLRLEYGETEYEDCKIKGFPHAVLVCDKRNDSCSCAKGLKVLEGKARLEAKQEEQELEEILHAEAVDDDLEIEGHVIFEDEQTIDSSYHSPSGVDYVAVAGQPPAPASADELEEAARQARRERKEVQDQLPAFRERLEEHLYHQAVMNRPGAFYAALTNDCWPQAGSLKSMELIYRRVARMSSRICMPNSVESLADLMEIVGRRLGQLGLDPLEEEGG